MSSDHPHIIYILSDQHRGQAMGHLGDPNVRTPVMDRVAQEGVSFARAYANCPICTPSRGTIFSGRHAHAGPVQSFWDVFKATSPSTATHLHGAGYRSAYFGKWHCGQVRDQDPPARRTDPQAFPRWGSDPARRTPECHRGGFVDWYGCDNGGLHYRNYYYDRDAIDPTRLPGYASDDLTDLAIDYLRRYDRDEPLFLVLSILAPHFPMEVPDRWQGYDPDALVLRPNCADDPQIRQWLAVYYAMVENLDWNIGRLLEALARLPRFKNALVVYVSDHGEFMGSHGRAKRKEQPYEESIRIPAIFWWPGRIPARGPIDGLFSLVDLLPTTLGLIDVGIPVHNQGTDFSPAVLGRPFAGPEDVLIEMVGNPRWNMDFRDWRGLVTEEWKYAYYETGEELFFNLVADPYELDNLACANPEPCAWMRRTLLARLAETREPYFDVLVEHGAPALPSIDIGLEKGTFNHYYERAVEVVRRLSADKEES